MDNTYIKLKDLEIYQLARELSRLAWEIYVSLNFHDQKIMGEQFIRSIDSIGANIAEGYRRYHHLDKIKFYYIARGSLAESSQHWLELLHERGKISKERKDALAQIAETLSVKLANIISATYRTKATTYK